MLSVTANQLTIYPIKSCAGLAVNRLQFSASGTIAGDREWAVINQQNQVVWQGSHPRLALVRPTEFEARGFLLSAPCSQLIFVDTLSDKERCTVLLWNDAKQDFDHIQGRDAGSNAARFLRNVTGDDLRLVQFEPGTTIQSHQNPIHICSEASLNELNHQFRANGQSVIAMERFRPNIVLSSDEKTLPAFLEEQFSSLSWCQDTANGKFATIDISSLCVRCIVPNVDPKTATVNDDVAHTVASASSSRHPGRPAYFGIYGKASPTTYLNLGATLHAELKFDAI